MRRLMEQQENTRKGAEEGNAWEKMGLEDIVRMANKVGLEYANAKGFAEECVLMKPTIRAQIMMRLDTGGLSESKLLRLTETDPEYIAFLKKLADARLECEKLRVKYESYKNLFEAKRSILSYQKAEMKLI
jgi:hypothetical protein